MFFVYAKNHKRMDRRSEYRLSRMALLFLLPYLLFAFCNSFMHVCLHESHGVCEPARAPQPVSVRIDRELATALSTRPAVSDDNHTFCAGCAWTKSSLSVREDVPHSILQEIIVPFVGLRFVFCYPEYDFAFLSRGPPAA